MNRATLIGRLGRDPEIRTARDQRRYANLSLATEERWTDKSTGERQTRTTWHNVTIWNQPLVDLLERHAAKGQRLLIEGQIEHRKYTPVDGIERTATDIVLRPYAGTIELLDRPPARDGAGDRPPPPEDDGRPTTSSGPSPAGGRGQGEGPSATLLSDAPTYPSRATDPQAPARTTSEPRSFAHHLDDDIPF